MAGDGSVFVATREFFGRVANAEPQVNIFAKTDNVNYSPAANRRDVPAHACRGQQKGVEDEARVDTRSDDRDGVLTSRGIDTGSIFGKTAIRESEFLARRQNVCPRRGRGQDVVRRVAEEGTRGVDEHVGALSENVLETLYDN